MAMSLSAVERGNPPSRQKACAACTKAKRRCNFASPACLRCSIRSIPCQYPQRQTKATARQRQSNQRSIPSGEVPLDSYGLPDLQSRSTCTSGAATLLTPPSYPGPELDATHGGRVDCIDPHLINYENPVTRDFPDGLRIDLPANAVQILTQSSALVPPVARDVQIISDIIASHLSYAIEVFMKVPRSMVEDLCAPWSHRSLYREHVPKSMRDAQAACALYIAKNNLNAPVIMRSIESYCRDLLASPPPTTAYDILAYAHALLLYQIIRLFDGDIIASNNATRDIPALETAAISLLAHVNFEEPMFPAPDLPLDPIAPTKLFWKQWLFQESARRTMLFIFFFLQTYRMVSGGVLLPCDGKLGLVHSWTFSAHLWQARTPVEFAKAWKEKNHFVVTNAGFRRILIEAKADDVDMFGRIMLSAMMGKDEADGWLAQRGGSLSEELCF